MKRSASRAFLSVGPKQLKRNAVTGVKVKDNALTGADVNEATLAQVPSAATAVGADNLDGLDSSAFARASSEGWHELGAPGEPAFGTGWQNV